MRLKEIHWEFTNECNLECKHCLASSGKSRNNELTTKDAKMALVKFHSIGVSKVNFTGGEPFSRQDLFLILQEAAALGLDTEIITNATMLDEKKLRIIKKLGIKLAISLDGANPTTHDFVRREGSFERVIKTLKLCQKKEIPVRLYTVITRNNISQIRLLGEIAKNYGCDGIHFNELNLSGRALEFARELSLSPKQSDQLTCLIAKTAKEVFGEKMFKPDKKCWIDGSAFFMSADGNLYLCTEIFQVSPHLTIGNIRSIDLRGCLVKNNQFKLLTSKDCCYSVQISEHITFMKNISSICNFLLEKSERIKTLERLYEELNILYQGIQKYCCNCQDLDCVGYIWLLPKETERLYRRGIEILEVNNNICFLYPFTKKGEINIEQVQPTCPWYKQKRCTIYNKRPLVCRMYPLAFTSEDDIIYLVLYLKCYYSRQKVSNISFLEQALNIFKRIDVPLLAEIVDTFRSVNYISKFPEGNHEYLRLVPVNKLYNQYRR